MSVLGKLSKALPTSLRVLVPCDHLRRKTTRARRTLRPLDLNKLEEDKFNGVNKGGLQVAKGEWGGVEVLANLGTKVNRRKRAIRRDRNIMVDVSMEGSNEGDGMCLKIGDMGE